MQSARNLIFHVTISVVGFVASFNMYPDASEIRLRQQIILIEMSMPFSLGFYLSAYVRYLSEFMLSFRAKICSIADCVSLQSS